MCVICVDLAKGVINYKEAARHLREFSETDQITDRHLEVVWNEIRKKKEMDESPFD